MRRAVIAAVILVLIAASLLGYTVYAESQALMALNTAIVGVEVSGADFTRMHLNLIMEFRNPTNHETPPFTAEFDVYISGIRVSNGTVKHVVVPAGANSTVEVPVTIHAVELVSAVVEALQAGEFELEVRGVMHSRLLFGAIPVSREFSASFHA